MTAITYTGTAPLDAEPDSRKVVIVSTASADTTQIATVSGSVGGTATNETNTLKGQREVLTANTFDSATFMGISAAAVGTVSFRSAGTSAVGTIFLSAVPADGDTLVIGLTGFLTTYTFRTPGRGTVTCPAFAATAQGDYVDMVLGTDTERFWFSKDGSNTSVPAVPGVGNLWKVDITGLVTATQVGAALESAMAGNSYFIGAAALGVVTVTANRFGVMSLSESSAGFSISLTAAGVADGANKIRTGYDPSAVAYTVITMATHIAATLNNGDVHAGVGTGTASSLWVSATDGTETVTITDLIACQRYLAWACTATGTALHVANPGGGANGTDLATISGGGRSAFTSLELNTEDLATATLPPHFAGPSDPVSAGGKQVTVWFKCEDVLNPLVLRIETSVDGTNWSACATGDGTHTYGDGYPTIEIDANAPALFPLRITPTEQIEELRLNILTNANAYGVALSVFVI